MQRRTFLKVIGVSTLTALLSRSPLTRTVKGDIRPKPFDIYLTFDDGPFSERDGKSGATDEVLAILESEKIPATFFLHGLHIFNRHGPVLARIVNSGHAIGNHLWSQGGNEVFLNTSLGRLARQFIETELRIREMLEQTDKAAFAQYTTKQPRLFRRPGGKGSVNEFLLPKYESDVLGSDLMAKYRDKAWMLKEVYDYSGWHINGGESVYFPVRPTNAKEAREFVLEGSGIYYGVNDWLGFGEPPKRTVEADEGLVVLMHEIDPNTRGALPSLIADLRNLGARFRALPRPIDKPNSTTVSIGFDPTVPK